MQPSAQNRSWLSVASAGCGVLAIWASCLPGLERRSSWRDATAGSALQPETVQDSASQTTSGLSANHCWAPEGSTWPASVSAVFTIEFTWSAVREISVRQLASSGRSEEHTSELQSRGHLV